MGGVSTLGGRWCTGGASFGGACAGVCAVGWCNTASCMRMCWNGLAPGKPSFLCRPPDKKNQAALPLRPKIAIAMRANVLGLLLVAVGVG